MNRFGEIADELTDLIEELEAPDISSEGRALKAALARAFAKACEAERALRVKSGAEEQPQQQRVRVRRRPAADFEPRASAVVIKLPLAWNRRGATAARRRLID